MFASARLLAIAMLGAVASSEAGSEEGAVDAAQEIAVLPPGKTASVLRAILPDSPELTESPEFLKGCAHGDAWTTLTSKGDVREAAKHAKRFYSFFYKDLKQIEKVKDNPEQHARFLGRLCITCFAAGDHAAALSFGRASDALTRHHAKPKNEKDSRRHETVAICAAAAAELHRVTDALTEDELEFLDSRQLQELQPDVVALANARVGQKYTYVENYVTATPLLERAHNALQSRCEERPTHYREVIRYLAICYGKQGRYEEAELLLRDVTPLVVAEHGEFSVMHAWCLRSLSEVIEQQSRFSEALALAERAKRVTGGVQPRDEEAIEHARKLVERMEARVAEAEASSPAKRL